MHGCSRAIHEQCIMFDFLGYERAMGTLILQKRPAHQHLLSTRITALQKICQLRREGHNRSCVVLNPDTTSRPNACKHHLLSHTDPETPSTTLDCWDHKPFSTSATSGKSWTERVKGRVIITWAHMGLAGCHVCDGCVAQSVERPHHNQDMHAKHHQLLVGYECPLTSLLGRALLQTVTCFHEKHHEH
jgi:hypothetical protein